MSQQPETPLSVRSFLPTAIPLFILGWVVLFGILQLADPSGGTRWALFFTLILALTGTSLPLMAYLNKRFASRPPASPGVVLRQSMWVGVYFATLAWLQLGRVLNSAIVVLLLSGLILTEWLLRLRERSQWRP